MRYILDTNAWIWLFSEPQLIRQEVRQILNQEAQVGLSPMSIVEVAQKAAKGKLVFRMPLDQWVRNALPANRVRLLPITERVALRAYEWPDFHGDPADRLIAATADVQGLTLATSDHLLLERTDLKTLSTR